MKRTALITSILSLIIISTNAFAAKLVEIKVVDKDYIMVYFKDGDVEFVDKGETTSIIPNVFTPNGDGMNDVNFES